MNFHDFKHDIRTTLSTQKWALPLFGLRSSNRSLIINKQTDIVIEGYPRCANTYTVVAFKQAQVGDISVAHHLHVPSQIMLASSWGIPALLLIRKPLDAIVSLKIRHPELDTRRCIRDYISFYESLTNVMKYPVIADFDDVTNDLAQVIHDINIRFGSEFSEFTQSEAAVRKVFKEIDTIRKAAGRSLAQIATPNKQKNAKKQEISKAVENAISAEDLIKANKLYDLFYSQRNLNKK